MTKLSAKWPMFGLMSLLCCIGFDAAAATVAHNLNQFGLAVGALLATLAVLLIQFNSQRSINGLLVALSVVLTIVLLVQPLAPVFLWGLFATIVVFETFVHIRQFQEVPSRRAFIVLAQIALLLCGLSEFLIGVGLAWMAMPLLLSAVVCFGDGWHEYSALIEQLEEEKEKTQTHLSKAGHDLVTGLPNMLQFEKVGESLLHNSGVDKLSVLLVKLNNFDHINQVMGHSNGNLLLAQAGQRIQAKVKTQNAVPTIQVQDGEAVKVACLGGVNFGIFINSGEKLYLAQKIAKDFADNLMEPLILQSCALEFDISVGIASYPDNGKEVGELVDHAFDVISAAQQAHKTNAQVSMSGSGANDKIALMNDLRDAIDNQQLSLHVQPLINLCDNQVYGGEVFIRWRHPEKGLIQPEDFIELAEQTGVLFSLTQWILEQVIIELKSLAEAGLQQRLSVNIGNTDLMHVELVETIEQLAQQYQVECSRLTLDIKESALLESPNKALEMMKQLDHRGVGIALDDFGTGYTSLAYLRQLPLSEVKIDSSFISTMNRSQSNRVITSAIIDIARKMELDVLAEGVEDEKTAQTLKEMGCSKAQGFYFSKPFELQGFTSWVKQWKGG